MTLEKHMIYQTYTVVGDFKTKTDALKEVSKVWSRMSKKNQKANSDFRPNGYGVMSLPAFRFDCQIIMPPKTNTPSKDQIKNQLK